MSNKIKAKSNLRDLVKSFRRYYLPFIISTILLVGSVVLIVLIPNAIQTLTNDIQRIVMSKANMIPETVPQIMNDVLWHAIKLLAFILGNFVLSFVSGFVLNTVIQKYCKDLRDSICKKINKLPLNYFDTRQIGDILSVITNDVDTLAQSLESSVSVLIASSLQLLGVLVAMFLAEWHMALVVVASLPVMIIIMFVTIKFTNPLFDKNQKELGNVNAIVEEDFSGQIVTKVFSQESHKMKLFGESNSRFKDVLYKSQAIGGLIQPLMTFVSYVTHGFILVTGGLLLINGTITDVGLITGFIVYVTLFQEPLAQLGQIASQIQLGLASTNRVFSFINEEELPDESFKKPQFEGKKIEGAVEFKDVSFGYDVNKLTIKNFNQTIKPGMKVAIIGPTGAGKTTLVNLLMRFYETTKGDILIDGVSIHDMSCEELRSIFGMILQETWVINGSLRENIVYNIPNVDENRLKEILDETNLTSYVETLPQGIDTVIQKESALSAGQKQLVTIARAMVENSPMLILDEATSNVDTRTEILIQNAMDSLTKGRTSFVIAHRLSTIKNADLIIVMKDGNVVETGVHDSLMKLNGLYSQIYNSQFQR